MSSYVRRLLIAALIIVLALAAWRLAEVILLLFGAVLVAILLSGLTRRLAKFTFGNRRLALVATLVSLSAIIGGVGFLFGTQVWGQLGQVISQAPAALDAFGDQIGIKNASDKLGETLSGGDGGQVFIQVASAGYTLVGGVTDLLIVIVAAIYLSGDPQAQQRAVVRLFPPAQQQRALETMNLAAGALRLWFLGQLVSMVLVGSLSGLAFWFIGLPSPLGLGVIAGVTNFVPFIGPFVGAIPAVLFALSDGPTTVVWTIVAVVAVQQLDANIFAPLVQRRMVELPPTVMLFAVLGFGILFGLLGVILAAPLAVLGLVLVDKLWVRDTLGEKIAVPGESTAKDG